MFIVIDGYIIIEDVSTFATLAPIEEHCGKDEEFSKYGYHHINCSRLNDHNCRD